MEGSPGTQATLEWEALNKTEASLCMRVQDARQAGNGRSGISQAPSLLFPHHHQHLLLAITSEEKVEGTHLPFKGMARSCLHYHFSPYPTGQNLVT